MYCEPLIKLEELFNRECCFISSLESPINITNFIESINFEWKLKLGDYKTFNEFCFEIIDIPNIVLGLPALNNWNVFTINIDPNSLEGNIKSVKKDILKHISNLVDTERVINNRILIFSIKFALNGQPSGFASQPSY